MKTKIPADYGYSDDPRKRRRQHRQAAKRMRDNGGDIARSLEHWHLQQAKFLSY